MTKNEWEKRIANFRLSGLTQEKWCEENNLTSNQYLLITLGFYTLKFERGD